MATMTHDIHAAADRRSRVGLGFAALAAASFGMSGVLATGLMDAGWSPAALVLCRVAVGALVLLGPALAALRGRWHLLRANAGLLTAYGLVAVAGCQLAYFNAVDRLPVAIALLIEYAAPVAVVGWLWARHRQRPRGLTVVGAAVAIAGLMLVLDVLSADSVDGLGVLWALGAMVGCAFFFVVSAGEGNGLPPIVLAAGGLVVGAVGLAIAGALGLVEMSASTSDAAYRGTAVPWWLPVLTLGVVTAAVAYVAGILATRALGARMASFAALLEVLSAVIFAWLLLDQFPSLVQLVGGVVLLVGVVLVKLAEPRAA
ncbi:MAG TPA: DMT family transporter [Nocardioides sp.]|jgi:drug/metabolite transporter (DMT)-like permease|nr:DMT family transporter [Nocardioides sp.]